MIIVQLAAEIETHVGDAVVEGAVAASVGIGDEDVGDRLVERIAMLRVIPHGVEIGQAERAPGAVAVAAAIAQAVEALARAPRAIMVRAPVPPAEVIGLGRTIHGHQPPRIAVALLPGALQPDEAHGQAQSGGFDNEAVFVKVEAEVRASEPFDMHAVAPRLGHVGGARRDRPARRARHRAMGEQEQPRHILLEHEQMRHGAGIGGQRHASARAPRQREDGRAGQSGAPHRRASAAVSDFMLAISTAAPIRSKKASAPNSGP